MKQYLIFNEWTDSEKVIETDDIIKWMNDNDMVIREFDGCTYWTYKKSILMTEYSVTEL